MRKQFSKGRTLDESRKTRNNNKMFVPGKADTRRFVKAPETTDWIEKIRQKRKIKGMIKEMHEAMNAWLIVERMVRFCRVYNEMIRICAIKVSKVAVELQVGWSLDEDADHYIKKRLQKVAGMSLRRTQEASDQILEK